MPIEGGCHCGRVRYAVDAGRLDDVAICHCTACRATSGGTHMTWATVPAAAFRWTRGAPKPHRSSDHGTRWFCPDCGTQMAFVTSKTPDRMDVAVTTTDDPARHPPTRQVWLRSRLPWVTPEPGLECEDEETLQAPPASLRLPPSSDRDCQVPGARPDPGRRPSDLGSRPSDLDHRPTPASP